MIVETEAYRGADDRACHAYPNKLTPRNAIMFNNGGVAYVYLCYGVHFLFNVVTGPINQPDAVLIRGIKPVEGLPAMLQRRKLSPSLLNGAPQKKIASKLASGPGSLAQALGININYNGTDLTGNTIYIEDIGLNPQSNQLIEVTTRVGLSARAGSCALRPWRFYWCGEK
ncbi:MAG: DNA-3-methyladenine glycosylase [Sphingobacteriales bacterium]|nr:DNA-3-methyladenine glycosylase [Sphingobacteriales bacterium]MBK7527109.1 DNA-3-methyladenine glycosylase [Sphingobacteriales bacterium]MBK8677602.1 DNA-3-methyladenine glycosylase [Sphingobacteriales bacterium]MBL0247753.1 DNA-3-methyladenine glycosylase [Sphingobacteriales bacterium]